MFDGFLNLFEAQQVLLAVSSTLELVLVLDAIISHALAHNLPSLAVDAEVSHELLMQVVVPKIHAVLVRRSVDLFGLVLGLGLHVSLAQLAVSSLCFDTIFGR